jgi:putative NADH-flavin reductase
MKLVAFGASGNCGAHFVRLAAAHGHQVTAVVRATTAYEPPAGVAVARGDVLDAAFVAGVIRGQDAVMSALGMRYKHPWARRESPDDFTSRATAHIIAGMKAAGVARIVLISAAGVGDSRPRMNLPMRLMLRVSNVGKAYADMERVEALLRASGLDWQAIRPTTLTHAPRTGRVRVVDGYPVTAQIPREDVATFMLAELESPEIAHRTPIITAG